MALTALTNTIAGNMQRSLAISTADVSRNTASLSSGRAVNSAKDDPSNLQISERYSSQINCMERGNDNADEGIAVLQLAEGALDETVQLLQRIRNLAIQSANGINSSADRQTIQAEAEQISREITRIACKTTYGGAQLLRGAGIGLISDEGQLSLQVGANAFNTIDLTLDTSFCLSSLQDRIGGLGAGFNEGAQSFDLSTQDKAQAVLAGIDAYITYVDGRRGEAGAQMKRLESTIRNQSSMHENESSARMRMRDADYAKETSELASAQVRQNVSAQMLMQANTQTDFVLALLR